MPYYQDGQVTLHHGDALEVARTLEPASVECIVTSPPYYGLRDYGIEGQYGLEESPTAYVETMRALFGELRRVLADDGTLWLNIGDSYAIPKGGGYNATAPSNLARAPINASAQVDYRERKYPDFGRKPKNLLGIPWRVAFALQDDGWILRNAIIWHKPNAMPESVTDRLSGRYEHVFLFSKNRRYWFDLDPVRESHGAATSGRNPFGARGDNYKIGSDGTTNGIGSHPTGRDGHLGFGKSGRNPGDVWTLPTQPFPGAHFAVYPIQLPQRCIQAGCKPGGTVLDPFNGSGTTGLAAQRTGRKYIGIDVNAEYLDLTLRERLSNAALDFTDTEGESA